MLAPGAGADAGANARTGVAVAIAALAFACLLWGMSFPLMKGAAATFDGVVARAVVGPGARPAMPDLAVRATFNAWRFALGTVLYLAVLRPRLREFSRADVLGGLVVGGFYGGGVLLQLLGLQFTLPSVAGFLTSMAVVFTPLGQAILFRRPVGRRVALGVMLATVGVATMSLPAVDAGAAATTTAAAATPPPLPMLGQALVLASAVLFTGQILALDHFGGSRPGGPAPADPARLTLVTFAAAAALNAAGALPLGAASLHRAEVLAPLWGDWRFTLAMAVLVVLSLVLAMHLMNRYQPAVSPAAAAVIYCLEPVFATAFSVALGSERLVWPTVVGGAAILAAVLVVALRRGPAR